MSVPSLQTLCIYYYTDRKHDVEWEKRCHLYEQMVCSLPPSVVRQNQEIIRIIKDARNTDHLFSLSCGYCQLSMAKYLKYTTKAMYFYACLYSAVYFDRQLEVAKWLYKEISPPIHNFDVAEGFTNAALNNWSEIVEWLLPIIIKLKQRGCIPEAIRCARNNDNNELADWIVSNTE